MIVQKSKIYESPYTYLESGFADLITSLVSWNSTNAYRNKPGFFQIIKTDKSNISKYADDTEYSFIAKDDFGAIAFILQRTKIPFKANTVIRDLSNNSPNASYYFICGAKLNKVTKNNNLVTNEGHDTICIIYNFKENRFDRFQIVNDPEQLFRD